MSDLLELAAACEKAEGPDRELDLLIMRHAMNIGGPAERAPRYTSSIDAALTLVPEVFWLERLGEVSGGRWRAELTERTADPEWGVCDAAATPALALCAASLRARCAA